MTTEESSVITHTLLDVIIDISLSNFVKYIWEDKQFVTAFLLNVQQAKDLEITPWESQSNDEYHRTLTAYMKIPGFAWLPWLPLYIHSKKKEVMSYSSERRELIISEFSKVEGLPWHDIDCNLIWKVHGMDSDTQFPQGRVHVVVTAQVIFLTPSFIQSFAESTAVTEMISFLSNWHNEVKRSLVDIPSSVTPAVADQNGALTKITRTITDDIGTNKPIHRRQVFRVPASPPATPTATKTHISSSSSDVSSSSVYSAVHSTAATISESDANSAAATVGTSTSASIISSAREATARSSSTGGSGGGGSGGDSSSSVMRRNATSIDNSTPSMLVAVQRFAYSSIWKVGENILYWSDAEGASNDKNFVFDCHNKSVTKSSF